MSDEYIKKDDAIEIAASTGTFETLRRIKRLPPADVIERAECDSCEVRNDSYIEAVSATGYDHGFEDGYSKGRAGRKHGEWIDSVDRTYMDRPMAECSECGWYINPYWINEYNFCPNCGSDNRRGDGNDQF